MLIQKKMHRKSNPLGPELNPFQYLQLRSANFEKKKHLRTNPPSTAVNFLIEFKLPRFNGEDDDKGRVTSVIKHLLKSQSSSGLFRARRVVYNGDVSEFENGKVHFRKIAKFD